MKSDLVFDVICEAGAGYQSQNHQSEADPVKRLPQPCLWRPDRRNLDLREEELLNHVRRPGGLLGRRAWPDGRLEYYPGLGSERQAEEKRRVRQGWEQAEPLPRVKWIRDGGVAS